MARRLSKAQTERRSEHSRAARNIQRRQSIMAKMPPAGITYAHPASHFGAPVMTKMCHLRIEPQEIAVPATRAGQRAHYDAVRARLGIMPTRAIVRPASAAEHTAMPDPVPATVAPPLSAEDQILAERRERKRIRDRAYRINQAAKRAGISPPDARLPKIPKPPQVKFHLPALPDGHDPSRLAMGVIVDYVAAAYGSSAAEIRSESRAARVVLPRQIAMYLCRTLMGRSYPEIARATAKHDHTTILHAVRKISWLIAADAAQAEEVEALRRGLTGGEL